MVGRLSTGRANRRGAPALVAFMTSGPVMVQVLEGENAVLRNRELMTAWLAQYDDGAPTSPGWWPEE